MKCLQKVEKGLGLDKYIPCVKRVEILEKVKITKLRLVTSLLVHIHCNTLQTFQMHIGILLTRIQNQHI